MTTSSQKGIERAVGNLRDLPTMPEVVAKVLEMTANPEIALSEVSVVIERDPGLAAKILRISNSPYYGMKQVVGTLKLALVILGIQEVRNIVLGLAVIDSLRDKHTERLMSKFGFWEHSVLVAAMSKKIGQHLALDMQGEDFVSGLLHDIGKMILWRQMQDRYETLLSSSGGYSEALCQAEIAEFNFDHADAAAVLAQKWNMPDALADAIWCHHPGDHRTLRNAKDPKLAALVRIANLAAREDWDIEDEASLASCNDEEAWDILLEGAEPMDIAERRRLLETFYDDVKDAPVPSL